MSAFTGTWRLARLALRRDRIKLSIWMIAIVGLLATAVPTLQDVYGSSQETIVGYAHTTASSFVGRFLAGPVDGPHFGSIVMMEYFLFVSIIVIFMSTLAVVRHTRQNEELGRGELIGSGVVGRYAPLTAALLVVVSANIITSSLIAVSLIANGLSVEGSLAMGTAFGGIGIVFASIAAVAAQIIGTARGANAAIGGIIGLAVVVRGIGDTMGTLSLDGTKVYSAWPSWLSPIGWGQQMDPFSDARWWVVGVFVAASVVLTGLAYWLTSHRDHGMGMIPARDGLVKARRYLLSPLGLAWRLQRSVLVGWFIAVVTMGVMFGIASVEFKDFFKQNEQLQTFFQAMGSSENFTDVFFVAIVMYIAIMIAGYGLQAILRIQTEESSGHLEPVLATSVGRTRWALSHIAIVVLGVVLLAVVAGFSIGLSYVLHAGANWATVERMTLAGLIQVPAVLVLVGFAVLLFGFLSRFTSAIVWAAFAGCLTVAMLGKALKLPEWILNISPFFHTPVAPADSYDTLPLVVMSAIAVGFVVVGLVGFRRRNLTTD